MGQRQAAHLMAATGSWQGSEEYSFLELPEGIGLCWQLGLGHAASVIETEGALFSHL